MEKGQFIVSLLVSNHSGVLMRVTSLFSRRAFNIDSLTVGVTEDEALSRITIVSHGDAYVKNQIVKQLQKLVDVKKVQLMDPDRIVVRELLLIKIKIQKNQLSEITEAVATYRANVVNLSPESMIISITGEPAKLNAFMQYIQSYGIIEICRTGPTAIGMNGYALANENYFEEEEENGQNVL
ncbi:MAG: acetolactate synthase small subunit [Christensenellales bacterium]|jgi:acetolactate synthase-1/3 small subunit